MSAEDRFKAAVEIIRSLPAKGNFQPPYGMQLSFYSHYKQATVGPCQGVRPSFWDIVGRSKFDAWQKLGTMDREAAMEKYVAEFVDTIKKLQANATAEEVQEALSYAEPKHIALFKPLFEDTSLSNENFPMEVRESRDSRASPSDDDIEKIDSHIESDEEYSDTFNHVENDRHSLEQADIVNSRAVKYQNLKNSASGQRQHDARISKADDASLLREGGLFSSSPADYHVASKREAFPPFSRTGLPEDVYVDAHHGNASRPAAGRERHPNHPVGYVQPVDNLSYAVVRLQYTMDEVVRRLEKLEHTLNERQSSRWSFFGGIQPHILAAILGWPLVLQLIIYFIRRRRVRVQLRYK